MRVNEKRTFSLEKVDDDARARGGGGGFVVEGQRPGRFSRPSMPNRLSRTQKVYPPQTKVSASTFLDDAP